MTEADFASARCRFRSSRRIPSDFSPAKKAALAAGPAYLHSVKLAFEAPRFWETDDIIFGGLAWTDRLNENVIYPSGGYGAAKGVIVGCLLRGLDSPGQSGRLRGTVARGALADQPRVHRGAASRPVAPARQSRHGGVGPDALFGRRRRALAGLRPASGRRRTPAAAPAMRSCCKPEGPIVFAGEHLSYQPTWQEGAALSAHEALKVLSAMARDTGRGRAAAS